MPESSLDPIVATNIQRALNAKGRTAYSVSVAIGHSPNWLYQVINGKHGILIPTLRELAKELGVSAGSLLDPPDLPKGDSGVKPGEYAATHQIPKSIGKRLKRARTAADMWQADLAAAMGERYDQTIVSAVEHGRSSLRLDGLAKAAVALGVSTDYLLGLTDVPTPLAELAQEVLKQEVR